MRVIKLIAAPIDVCMPYIFSEPEITSFVQDLKDHLAAQCRLLNAFILNRCKYGPYLQLDKHRYLYRWNDPAMSSHDEPDITGTSGLPGWCDRTSIALSKNIPNILGTFASGTNPWPSRGNTTIGSYCGVILTDPEFKLMMQELRVNTAVEFPDSFRAHLGTSE